MPVELYGSGALFVPIPTLPGASPMTSRWTALLCVLKTLSVAWGDYNKRNFVRR
jgi:hypothetical protein